MTSAVLHCYCKCLTLSFNLSCVGLVIGNWPQSCSPSACLMQCPCLMITLLCVDVDHLCKKISFFLFFLPVCAMLKWIYHSDYSVAEKRKSGLTEDLSLIFSKFMSLKYLVATVIGTSCLECGNCWWLVQNQLIFQLFTRIWNKQLLWCFACICINCIPKKELYHFEDISYKRSKYLHC